MIPEKGQYYYNICGSAFRIYYYDGVTGSPVPDEPTYYSRDAARKRVYELNGWKLKNEKRTTP